jgi:hypothetical protein
MNGSFSNYVATIASLYTANFAPSRTNVTTSRMPIHMRTQRANDLNSMSSYQS